MGIVNVTPDSFSDGGRCFDPQRAVEHGLRLVADGADLLDIGGESTRPGSLPVPTEEELRRTTPVIAALAKQVDVPLSIDTTKAAVAQGALEAGAQIVNDITALSGDPEMTRVVAQSRAAVCLMHMQGTPRTMQNNPTYVDVVAEVMAYLTQRRDRLIEAGFAPDQIAVDPGIGFGKTLEHNLELLRQSWRLHSLGCPVLVGPSRKGFLGKVLGDPAADRTMGTIGVALSLARQGVQVLRVHDVAAVRQAITLFEATGGVE